MRSYVIIGAGAVGSALGGYLGRRGHPVLLVRRSGWRFASYSTSKFGLTGFTEALRQEAGVAGIRVSIVEPGATATEIADSISDPEWREMIHHHTHKDGAMDPADIVAGVMLAIRLPRRANLSRILIQPTIDVEPMP